MTEPHLDHTAPKRFAISLFPFWISPRLQRRTAQSRNTLDLAQHAEKWGYNRYWLAEHHNMPESPVRPLRSSLAMSPGHEQDPRRSRGIIAEPRSLGHSRAVRHPGIALSRPDRSRLRSCAGIGSAYIPGASPRSRATARTSRTASASAELLPAHFGLVHARQGNSRRRSACTGLALGSSGFSAQLAGQLGLPFSLRATLPRLPDGRARPVPHQLPSFIRAEQALCHDRRERDLCRYR